MKHKNLLKIALFFLLISNIGYGQIYQHDFGSTTISGKPYSVAPGTFSANLSNSSWTTSATGFTSFAGSAGQALSLSNSSGTPTYTLTFDVASGFKVSITQFSFWRQRSAAGAQNWSMTINDIAVGSGTVPTSGANTGSLNVTNTVENLTGTVTVVLTMSGASSTGTFRLDDFTLFGSVTSASSDPLISFDSATSIVNETNTTFNTLIPVTMTNYAAPVTVSVTVIGGTAEAGDYTLNTSSLSFNTNGTLNVSLDINDDADDENETVILEIEVTSGSAILAISQHTVTILDDDLPKIIISEIMYNTPSTDDEWIELYNDNGSSVDISGWKLEYNSFTFTFPGSTNLAADSYIIIAVGSNGDGTFNNDNPFTPDFNNLSVTNAVVKDTNLTNRLNNTSGTIVLKNDSDNTIDTVSYTTNISSTNGNGASYEIIDFSADNSATSSNWQASLVNGGSPKRISGSTWSGAISSDWSTSGNWIVGIPIATSDVLIPSGLTNYPTVATAATVNSLIMNSGSSLIAQDAFTGTVTYKRTLAYNALLTEGWHLVSSPVVSETFDNDYVTANGLAINGANNAIATYTTASNTWAYMQTNGGGTFTPGIGYSVKKQSSTGDISFTGTINTSDVSVGVVTGGTNSFNLIGNPFTSYLNSVDFINGNSANLATNEIWVFNQSTSNYEVKNLASSFVLAPVQGFFVRANAATNLTIAESYQTTNADTFLKTSKTEINLSMNDGSNNRFAKIYYLDNATTSFDNGYDGETFGGIVNTVDVFTHLVANSEGKKFQIQSLPNSDFENMVVPVGIKAAAGKEITFSAEAMNLPDGINVYLEDRTANTVTLLSEANATYKVTLAESLDGIGRFYLHTKASGVLSTTDVTLNNISIYSPAKSTLRIAGLSQGKASVKIYNLLGKQVFANAYNTTGVINMNLPKLATGLYVVQLETEKGTLNKKITLE
jgi:hypothetical protein